MPIMSAKLRYIGVILCCVSFAGVSLAATSQTEADCAAALAKAKDSDEYIKTLLHFIWKASADELDADVASTNDSIALAAAWERVSRATPVPKEDGPNTSIDAKAAARFLGVVEGRFRVVIPTLWREAIMHAGGGFYSPSRVAFGFLSPFDEAWRPPLDVPGSAKVTKEGETWEVSVDQHVWRLPRNNKDSPPERAAVLIDGDVTYIALYDDIASEFPLFAITKDKTVWQSRVWGNRWPGSYEGGHHDNRVQLVKSEGKVYLFGVEAISAYIEAFEAASGKNLCRFATSYLWVLLDEEPKREK